MTVEATVVVLPRDLGPLRLERVELPDPGPHEVLVAEIASGICHSQLHQMHQQQRTDVVLGHEASGQVLAVGSAVTHCGPGDHVLLTFVPRDAAGTSRKPRPARLDIGTGDEAVSQNIFTWASHTIADEQYVVAVPPGTPMDVTSVVGCAVLTGAGSVLNAAGVTRGDSVAVWGAGGVGLPAIAAARIVGADPVIAVDVDDAKLALARRFGATHTVLASDDVATAIRELTPAPADHFGFRGMAIGGVDYGFDCVARQETIEQMLRSLRNSRQTVRAGGTGVIVGVPQANVELPLVEMLMHEKSLVGAIGGTSSPAKDFPTFLDWYRRGELDLDALVTTRFGLDEINEATTALGEGRIAGRAIIELG